MAIPVNSNLQSKKCGEVISSNCVTYDGPATGNICKGASMSEALFAVSEASAGCCEGSFPAGHQSCWTGEWVDFSSSIPTSGTGGGYSYTISAFGGGVGLNVPQYKWTKEGDLKVRGGFVLRIIPTTTRATLDIPLTDLTLTCFPTGYTGGQFAITSVDIEGTNVQVLTNLVTLGLSLTYPIPGLRLSGGFISTGLVPINTIIGLGGTTFNIA